MFDRLDILGRLQRCLQRALVRNQNLASTPFQNLFQFNVSVHWIDGCDFGTTKGHRQNNGRVINVIGRKDRDAIVFRHIKIKMQRSSETTRCLIIILKSSLESSRTINDCNFFVEIAIVREPILRHKFVQWRIWSFRYRWKGTRDHIQRTAV